MAISEWLESVVLSPRHVFDFVELPLLVRRSETRANTCVRLTFDLKTRVKAFMKHSMILKKNNEKDRFNQCGKSYLVTYQLARKKEIENTTHHPGHRFMNPN